MKLTDVLVKGNTNVFRREFEEGANSPKKTTGGQLDNGEEILAAIRTHLSGLKAHYQNEDIDVHIEELLSALKNMSWLDIVPRLTVIDYKNKGGEMWVDTMPRFMAVLWNGPGDIPIVPFIGFDFRTGKIKITDWDQPYKYKTAQDLWPGSHDRQGNYTGGEK